jgi:hypothetical protein
MPPPVAMNRPDQMTHLVGDTLASERTKTPRE